MCICSLLLKSYKCCGKVWKLLIHSRWQHQFKGYEHLEHPWLSSLWAICRMCYQRFYGISWPSYIIMVFKEIEENHLLWESMLFAMDPSIWMGSTCFQWGNGKHGGICVSNYIKLHKVGQGMGSVVTRSMKQIWFKTWSCT
jgi:hypothetical protein